MNIAKALRHLYPDADPQRDYRVEDRGAGPELVAWALPDPPPAPAQLRAAEEDADRNPRPTPPTIHEQLDAIFEGGAAFAAMKARRDAVRGSGAAGRTN